MEAENVIRHVVNAALDKKGERPEVLDLRGLVFFTDYFVILSGRNRPQVEAIVERIIEVMREQGVRPSHVEGQDVGDWVLIDLGDVLVHVFLEDRRLFYDLEGLWRDAKRVAVAGAD